MNYHDHLHFHPRVVQSRTGRLGNFICTAVLVVAAVYFIAITIGAAVDGRMSQQHIRQQQAEVAR